MNLTRISPVKGTRLTSTEICSSRKYSLTAILLVIILVFHSAGAVELEYKVDRLEVAPRPYTVQYAPADSSISLIDPPGFVWLPVEKARQYTLQYSRKQDFPAAQTVSVICPRTIHVPRQTLGSGTWYWRFGIPDEQTGDMIFSRHRVFTIAENATAVPFPDVKAVIAKLNGVRPRDFVRAVDLERFRKLGAGPLNSYIMELKDNCEQYLEGPLHPEPAFLSKDPEQRKVDFSKVMRSTRQFNAGLSACATAYLLTGEEKYGLEARRRLLHLASWDPEGSTNLFHNDEPGHEIIRVMANSYDWIYPLLSDDDKKTVKDVLSVRIPQLYKILIDKPFEVRPYESHAMDYYIGDLLESCICMAGELPVEEMFEYVLQQLWSPYFPPYGGEDGGWCEGPGYWQYSAATFLRNFMLVQQTCGIDLTRKPWLQNTPFFKLYCNPPYSKMSPFGDGQSGPPNQNDIMYKLGITLNNPYALWYADQRNGKPRGLERFIYYKEGDDKGTPPVDLPQARCFNDVGLACMHSDLANGHNNVQFLMRSSPFGSISHAYADQNAFALFAYGEPLAIASGYYPYYSSPHHSKWTRETKASNCILVDGEGQKIRDWNARGRIVDFATTDYAHYALGDATAGYAGRVNQFLRHALFLRPTAYGEEPVIILYDEIACPKPASYDWLLHSLEQMDLDEAAGTVHIKRGAAHLKVQFLTPQDLQFSQTEQFNVTPENENMLNQWHFTARTNSTTNEIRFVTVLMPYREGEEARLPMARLIAKPGWVAVELTSSGLRQIAAFRAGAEPGSQLMIDNFSTRSDIAAVVYDLKGKKLASMEVGSK